MATQLTLNDGSLNSAGALKIKTNGTTEAVDISTGQVVTLAKDAVVNGLTVGKGAGAVSTNTAVGASALNANTTGARNTALGNLALAGNTTTTYSDATAIGYNALYQGGGGKSTAIGAGALSGELAAGGTNTAVGYNALTSDTSGGSNVGIGAWALQANTTASNNTAVGYQAAYSNTTGQENTVVGQQAFYTNTTGNYNSVLGVAALYANTTGSYNVAIGETALRYNTTASNNVAVGYQAGYSNTTSANQTFIGRSAGYSTTGVGNTFVGTTAGYNTTTGTYNTFIGFGATSGDGAGVSVTTGSKNTIIGGYSGNQGGLDIRTSSNYIVLSDGDGNPRGIFDSSGNLLVGTTSAPRTGMSSFTTSGQYGLEVKTTSSSNPLLFELRGNSVTPNTTGFAMASSMGGVDKFYLYTNGNVVNVNNSYGALSDIKLKENITDATPKLSGLMQVRVVNYNLKSDPEHKQLGVIAQELEQIFPAMIDESPDYEQVTTTDEEGNETTERVATGTTTKSVKYSVFVPMLIKAIQEQQAIITALTARIEALENQA